MDEKNVLTNNNVTSEMIIFSRVFKQDNDIREMRQKLITTLKTASVFKDEYYVFFLLISENIRGSFTDQFLRVFLATNRAGLSRSANINLSRFKTGNNDEYLDFVDYCVGIFNECKRREVEDSEYYTALDMYKMTYVAEESITVLEESVQIVTEGARIGRKTLSGYEDMKNHIYNRLNKIDSLNNTSERKGIIVYGDTDNEEEEESTIKRISSYGIDALDEAIGGIYEGDMISLLAPAKGCKSRLATFILHNCLINGVSCIMWSVENGYKGWEALIRARHFNWLYNKNVTDVAQKKFIDADMIRKNELSPELKEMERASWADLRTNINYGRLANLDEDFNEATCMTTLDKAIESVNAKFVCVDYLQLIGKGETNGSTSKNERISAIYISMLQFLKSRKIAGIFPAQLKQTVVGELNKADAEDFVSKDLRDAAGESYEVIKTPDVNLALYGSIEDIKNGQMLLLSVPSRNSAPFSPISLYVDAGTCTFASI